LDALYATREFRQKIAQRGGTTSSA
jgi:hypothetical protein